jgi:hypothetical protein
MLVDHVPDAPTPALADRSILSVLDCLHGDVDPGEPADDPDHDD